MLALHPPKNPHTPAKPCHFTTTLERRGGWKREKGDVLSERGGGEALNNFDYLNSGVIFFIFFFFFWNISKRGWGERVTFSEPFLLPSTLSLSLFLSISSLSVVYIEAIYEKYLCTDPKTYTPPFPPPPGPLPSGFSLFLSLSRAHRPSRTEPILRDDRSQGNRSKSEGFKGAR